MKIETKILSALLSAWLAAPAATAANEGIKNPVAVPPAMKGSLVDTIGSGSRRLLTDKNKISLYTFDEDSENKTNCAGSCLTVWPPMIVPANAAVSAPFATITLADGRKQLTVDKLPLYYFFQDKKPGDLKGEYPDWRPVPALDGNRSVAALMANFAEDLGVKDFNFEALKSSFGSDERIVCRGTEDVLNCTID